LGDFDVSFPFGLIGSAGKEANFAAKSGFYKKSISFKFQKISR